MSYTAEVICWNGCPHYIQNKILTRLENQKKKQRTITHLNTKILFQYFAEYPMQGQTLIKYLVKKVKRHLDKRFKL